MAKTALEEVKDRMRELKEQRASELQTIQQKMQEAEAKIDTEGRAMQQAIETMDEEAYIKAKQEKQRARLAHEMYKGRYSQIMKQELISEADSDAVIDSLLSYEGQLAADFAQDIAGPMRDLAQLYTAYTDEVKSVELTLLAWQQHIHKNYRTRGGTVYTDEVTGETTDRSKTPIPVHTTPYTGSPKAAQLGDFLRKAGAMYTGAAE